MNRYSRISRPSELSDNEKKAWGLLWKLSEHQSPFMTCFFSSSVEKAGVNVRVAVIMGGEEIIGFFPYQYSSPQKSVLGHAERVGGEMSDYCGVICKPGVRFTEVELLELAKIHCFDFSHLHSAQLEIGLSSFASVPGHLIRISTSGVDYWKNLSEKEKRLTQDTQRCIGKLEREVGAIVFDAEVRGRADLLNFVIQMKRDQYRRTGVFDALKDDWRRKLLHVLYEDGNVDCRGLLSTIVAGDELIAVHFGVVAGGTLHYWFPVYDAKYAKYSPGRVLYKYMIEAMDAMGLNVIDNGAGDAAYKIALSNEAYEVYSGRWNRKTPAAFVSMVATSIQWRLQKISNK